MPIPLALRLFLPEEWTRDPARCARAAVPETEVVARSKGEIALVEPDRVLAAGLRFGTVLADAGYGASAEFRRGLDERGLRWAVGIPRNQKVYGATVQLVAPSVFVADAVELGWSIGIDPEATKAVRQGVSFSQFGISFPFLERLQRIGTQ